MSAITNKQYRPVSVRETTKDDAVSVRLVQDMADSINNMKAYVKRQKLLSYIFKPAIVTIGDNVERLLLPPLAPRFMPSGYHHIAMAYHCTEVTSGTVNIYIRLATTMYTGPVIIIGYPQSYAQVNMAANSTGVTGPSIITTPLNFVYDSSRRVWPLVTYKATSIYNINTLDAWPTVGANY